MSRVLAVSLNGFYAWRRRLDDWSLRHRRRVRLDDAVRKAFSDSKGRSGSPRWVLDLAEAGYRHDHETIADSMRRQGLRAKAGKKFKAITNARHNLPVAKNLLEQGFSAAVPNQKSVGDITHLWMEEGWLYLAVIIDLHSRLVVGWAMSKRMTAQLACDALRMAMWRRHKSTSVIMHCYRGGQHCSASYQGVIREHGLLCSTSAKGNCYDNACSESFFDSLKVEAVHGQRFATREEMRQAVLEYIEVDYNRTRQRGRIAKPDCTRTGEMA